jgi:hypothetical protein
MPTTDGDFERTFADLAFATLRDRAPSLFDYLVGFQVLDANEEQTHAVGVFGCKVGEEWVYLPVFFANGELKGSELMYLKDQDMFVPLQENWVSYVLNRRPYVLGEASSMSRRDLTNSPADFTSFAYNPNSYSKTASVTDRCQCWRHGALQPWARPVVEGVRGLRTKLAAYRAADARLDLHNFVRDNGPTVNRALLNMMLKNATVGEAVLAFYPPERLMVANYDFTGLNMDAKIRAEKQANSMMGYAKSPTLATGPAPVAKAPVGGMAAKPAMPQAAAPAAGSVKTAADMQYAAGDRYARTATGGSKVRYMLPGDFASRGDRDARDVLARAMGTNDLTKVATDKQEYCEAKPTAPESDHKPLPWEHGKKTYPKDVEVITRSDIESQNYQPVLKDSEKERLMKGEIVIKDNRSDASRVYRAEYPKTLTKPDGTGVYRMVSKAGSDLTDILVIAAPMTIGAGQTNCVTAVTLDKRQSVNVDPSALAVTQSYTSPGDWDRFFDAQPKIDSMQSGESYVIITANGRGSIPFKVLHKRENTDGTTEVWVDDECCVERFGDYNRSKGAYIRYSKTGGRVPVPAYTGSDGRNVDWRSGRHIVIGERDGGMVAVGDTLFVPSGARVFHVKESNGYRFPAPGSSEDAMLYLLATQMVKPMKVYAHGYGDYSVTDAEKTSAHMGRLDALRHLIVDQGLRQKAAEDLLTEADRNRGVRVLVRYPDGHPLAPAEKRAYGEPGGDSPYLGAGPTAPAQPEQYYSTDSLTGVPTVQPQSSFMVAPDLMTQSSDRQHYNPDPKLDQNPYQLTQDAAATGQKDVLDAGVVGSLLKVVDSDSLVDKYLGDMFLGMDRVGRVLFLYYQHNDAFRERYGDEDMQELEDSLKNTFKGTGDLVLFLKQRTVEENPEQNKTEVDLTPTAN